jgi:myo-inositol-hexaphosphate 3-phosphohydrolase
MIKQSSVDRYYIRDENNKLWCFNATAYTGKKSPAIANPKAA